MAEPALSGRCMCGAVAIAAEPVRGAISACHCKMCQRWAAGPFLAVGCVEASVAVTGPAKEILSSGYGARGFCPDCGSSLWWRNARDGASYGDYFVSAGLFDTGEMPIRLEVFHDRKPAGYAFAGETKKMTEAQLLGASEGEQP